jgi:exonuclease III
MEGSKQFKTPLEGGWGGLRPLLTLLNPLLLTIFLTFSALIFSTLTMGSFFENNPLSISCLNCNSLNMSNTAKWNQILKINGICKLKNDIIFLCDIRLSNKNLISAEQDMKKNFLYNSYDKYNFYANSTKNSRGVGILIKHSLNAQVQEVISSDDENILLIRASIKGTELILISIYGPNNNNRDFFTNLTEFIRRFSNCHLIIGGDWNCTYSSSSLAENIDCLNMKKLPNALHSNILNDICDEFNLADPYRYFYPSSRDYTYVPRNDASINKSRIDYFLVSENLFDSLSDCTISPNLQNKLFDHKAVTIKFNEKCKAKIKSIPAISNKDLDDILIDPLVYSTVCETYLIHSLAEPAVGPPRQAQLETCGRIKMLIREAGPPFELRSGANFTAEEFETRNRKINRIAVLKQSLDIRNLENLELTCSIEIFFETLMINVKNNVISHQAFMRKLKIKKMDELNGNLKTLKKDYLNHEQEILTTEKLLNNLVDADLRSELEKFRHFDILNAEKMTPRFLTLSKVTKKTESLAVICREDGSEFETEKDRYCFIRDFYRQIYKPDIGNANDTGTNRVTAFLGQEICNNNIVKGSKLTEAERVYFDRDFSVQELDFAIQKLNEKSAGGADGISTKFLKKYWAYLRITVHRYTLSCFRNKKLSQSTNSAIIKLIPKKGNLKSIKNWRPISLLNSVFKIISKAVDVRMEKISEILFSRSQKGFTAKRYIQECIINIVDTIGYCEARKIPAFILALDMAKAFDTVKHEFATETYKFFGIGNNLINTLNTISTNRSASIILDNGTYSDPFDLGSGFPQGAATSPKQFNSVEQVLIFKIEFDPRIKRIIFDLNFAAVGPERAAALPDYQRANNRQQQVFEPEVQNFQLVPDDNQQMAVAGPDQDPPIRPVPDPEQQELILLPVPHLERDLQQVRPDPAPDLINAAPVPRTYGRLESNNETGKVEAFADDTSALGLLERGAFVAITEILVNFEHVSGLKCNLSKSQVMLIGYDGHAPDYVINCGFEIVDSLKILGFTITKNWQELNGNFSKAFEKIKNTGTFWERFRLSLPGRICVAKTLMLSQISYFGSILSPSTQQLAEIEQVIQNFVSGKLKIGKELINCGYFKGGLNMIDLRDFLSSLKCSWVKRTLNCTIDNWRKDLNTLSRNNVLILDPAAVPMHFPIKRIIALDFWRFKAAFYLRNENFEQSFLLGNPLLISSRRNRSLYDPKPLFGENVPDPNWKLKISDVTDPGGRVKNFQNIREIFGLHVTIEMYNDLCSAIYESRIVNQKQIVHLANNNDISLEHFLTRFKKGSKPFRKIFELNRCKKINVMEKTTVKTFFRLTSIQIPVARDVEQIIAQWSCFYYPNKLREFIFKFRTNQLGLNTRVSHFNANISRACTFCNLKRIIPAPDETFLHLFYECPSTNTVLNTFVTNQLPELNLVTDDDKKKFFLLGHLKTMDSFDNFFIITIAMSCMFYIWECKLKKQIPAYMSLLNDMYYSVENIRRISGKIREAMSLNIAICRSWHEEAQRRR